MASRCGLGRPGLSAAALSRSFLEACCVPGLRCGGLTRAKARGLPLSAVWKRLFSQEGSPEEAG